MNVAILELFTERAGSFGWPCRLELYQIDEVRYAAQVLFFEILRGQSLDVDSDRGVGMFLQYGQPLLRHGLARPTRFPDVQTRVPGTLHRWGVIFLYLLKHFEAEAELPVSSSEVD